jgi:hypothetical protein
MVIESPNRFQPFQASSSDSDIESINSNNSNTTDSDSSNEAINLFSQQAAITIQRRVRSFNQRILFLNHLQLQRDRRLSAIQIQRNFRIHQLQQSSLTNVPAIMSTKTDYEFPGGFRVAIDVVKPTVNTDGLNAGRLYKKENRPKEGSKEEKELLTDIKANRYPKYKVMNISLKDPEKLASNLSILDNLTYSEQFMVEFNMEDTFCICFPDNDKSPASLSVDAISKKPLTKDLFQDHRDISVEQVALSNRWYSRYAIFTESGGTDRSFAKELEWSLIHFRHHVEQELYNVVHAEYVSFPPEERGGPLFLKLLLLHLVVSNEANLELLVDTVKNYKININVENEDMDKVLRLLKAVTATILHLRNDKTLPEKYIEHLCTALQTTSCSQFNEEIAGIEKDVTTSRRIQSANKSASMRQHTGARTIATTMSGLILENTMEGVDFIFSLALTTYRDLKADGHWNAAMRPTPGTAGAAGGFVTIDQITGPFCWNCESTEHAFPHCPKARDTAMIAKNRALYREHKGDDTRGTNGGRGRGDGTNRWTKWKRPRPEEQNKRIINNAPFTWNPTTKRWMKDDTPPSGLGGLTAGTPPLLPLSQQNPGEDQSRSGGPFPPTSVGDDVSQVSESVSPAELASLQLQMANLMNMMSKIGPS